MIQRQLQLKYVFAIPALISVLWLGAPAKAQSAPAQDNDTTRAEVAHFDQFLDSHREIAEQLRKDPSLVNNGEFVKNHPPLQSYLRDHPGAREEFKEHPDVFMRQEERFDQREDGRSNDVSREELARFNQFLDSHREIAEQVRKNPSLVNNQAFMENHPALLTYMHEHPELREQVKQNPTVFVGRHVQIEWSFFLGIGTAHFCGHVLCFSVVQQRPKEWGGQIDEWRVADPDSLRKSDRLSHRQPAIRRTPQALRRLTRACRPARWSSPKADRT